MEPIYLSIQQQATGSRIRELIKENGYSVKDIQEAMGFENPQAVYKWISGVILPSVDHLLMLSELLNVHMEDLLVKKNSVLVIYDIEQCYAQTAQRRFMAYYKKIYQPVA